MENSKPNILKKSLKVALWIFVSIMILGIVARISLTITPVHNFVKSKILSTAKNSLTADLSIESLSGDLWSNIEITGIYIGNEKDTLATIDTISASYDILSVLSGTFDVNRLELKGGAVKLIESTEMEDSSFTFTLQEVIKEDTVENPGSTIGVNIEQLSLRQLNAFVYSKSALPDSILRINDISLAGAFKIEDEIEASLYDLSMVIKEGRLPNPIKLKASGDYINKAITLEDLVINTGRSFLQSNAFVDLGDSTINSNIDLKPFSTKDLQPYLSQDISSEELQLSLKAKGTIDDLQIELTANSFYVKGVEAVASLNLSGTPTLKQFGLKGTSLNIAGITNDSLDMNTGLFQLTMDGELTPDYEQANVTWGFTVEGLRFEDYTFRRFFGSGILKEGRLTANLDVTTSGEERLTTNSDISNVFSGSTNWNIEYHLNNFNASYWAEGAVETDVSLHGVAEGVGFELSKTPWKFQISNSTMRGRGPTEIREWEKRMNARLIDKVEIGEQPISFISVSGDITKDSVFVKGFTDIIDSRINFNASISDPLSEIPSFRYQVSTIEFNANELVLIEDVPTAINLEISGKGRGFSLEDLRLEGFTQLDSSIVNGAKLELLEGSFKISDGILVIPEAELRSEIASANFSGRKNIRDEKDPDNILSFDAELKNTQSLAPIADLETLQIKGLVSADIKENTDGFLEFNGKFDLNNIIVDDLFRASKIEGTGEVVLKENEEGMFELDVIEPEVYGTAFQDIRISTESLKSPDSIKGTYSFEIQDNGSGQISNEGTYELELSSMNAELVMSKLDFITNSKSLRLQENFNISFKDGAIRTDSLILRSEEGAFLSLSIPYADSLNQQIWLVGESFNFGILQEIIVGERFVDGVLFGEIDIKRTKEELNGNGNLELQNIEYEGVRADIFSLNFNAQNKRVNSNLAMIWDNEEVISGTLDVPFDLGDPKEFSDSFYDQKVSGSLKIVPTSLERFEAILEKFEITGTSGVVSFNGDLSGTAGAPNFEGLLNIEDPVLSEIKLDSVFASFGYNHTEENIFIDAEVIAAKQKAADVAVDIPFSYNFKTFEVNMIDEDKPVSATIITKDFNLSVFNDFLDKKFTKNLKGILNGELKLQGTENSLSSEGYFDLTKSSLEVPIGGITLSGIKSRIEFAPSKILLKEFTAKSGKGEFKANGDINLDGLTPTTVDIQAKANQFKMLNTTEYNMVVDIDSRLNGPAKTPTATGRFAVKNGFIVLDNFGDKAVEEVQLEGEEASSFSLYDSLAIDMQFFIERNFFVRNRRYLDLEVEIMGQLEAQKETKGELSLFGTLTGDGGYLRPLGKRFELEEAELLFSGPAGNPDLNVKSAFVPSSYNEGQDVTLYYIIKGTAENPEFSFESSPTMEQQDIICYTLFNRPCYALESWQSAITSSGGSSPTDLLAGVLIDEVEALATRELGVDVVQIDNTRVGNESGTSIKTGWYLNERTFFAIVNEITSSDPKTLFILEYALSKTWDLIITEGEDSNRRGIDFRWQFDY